MRKLLILAVLAAFSLNIKGQTPCEAGLASGYACENIDLWSHVPPTVFGTASTTTNEVWGWTDPLDGKEYVLLGASNGVAFFDISNPLEPFYLGLLPKHTSNSLWRTLRTFNNYMFVGSEANGHGMQVFDLTRLRSVANPPEIFTEDAHYAGFGKCHTLVIHEESGMLYACGTNTFSGGLHIVNVNNPLAPVLAGSYDLDGYTHEAQVMTYNGPDTDYQGDVIVFCYNGNNPANLTIVNATDPNDVTTVSITGYPGSAYCHQGWLTEDGKYLLMDDELDEYYNVYSNTRTLIWNVEDLDAPQYLGDFNGPTAAIDHNQYIIDNLSYQSNYTAGLRVIDVTGIEELALQEVAYFDHYPTNDDNVFDGQWMNYPYFASGVIPVTDIDNGMFLLQLNFLNVTPQSQTVSTGIPAFYQAIVAEGFSGPIHFEIEGLPQDFIVEWEANDVTAPSTTSFTITAPDGALGVFDFQVVATGAFQSFRRDASIEVTESIVICPDLTGDGVVGTADLIALNQQIDCNSDCTGDFNQDGVVDVSDFLIFLAYFGFFCN
jgi:choice-of-anchor B domain-containing protein